MNRACIFIDGENLRHSIKGLFPGQYNNSHYIPVGEWQIFLEAVTSLATRKTGYNLSLVRAYWYVVNELSYNKSFLDSKFKQMSLDEKVEKLKDMAKSAIKGKNLRRCSTDEKKDFVNDAIELLGWRSNDIEAKFSSWKKTESIIQKKTDRLQFQKFGYLKVTLDDKKGKTNFHGEKGVDIKLATDLVALKDIYDVAIIISGDGDYIPAVNAIKNMGKQVVMVDFKNNQGQHLPGGSWKLKEHCDFDFSITHKTMDLICGYNVEKVLNISEICLKTGYEF